MYAYWLPAQREDGATLVLAGFDRSEIDGKRISQHGTELGPVEEHLLSSHGKPVRAYYTRTVTGYHSRPSVP